MSRPVRPVRRYGDRLYSDTSLLEDYAKRSPYTHSTEISRAMRSGRCACVIDPVPEGCLYASSDRNTETIKNFTTGGESRDELKIFVYLAGHSGMINTHQMPNEPKITVGCNTFFFNNAGESSFTPVGVASNHTSGRFMTTLSDLSDSYETIDKGRFYSFLERFRDNELLPGSPISLYTLGTQIDDLNVLGAGTLYDTDYDRNPDGSTTFTRNPASVRIFVKNGRNKVFGNLTSPNLIDMFLHTIGNLQMRPSQYSPGYFDITIDPYMYHDQLSGYRHVRLSDIYNFIRNVIAQANLVNTDADMNEFMSHHVVLVSTGCRCLGTGDVCRVSSVEPQHSIPDDIFDDFSDDFPDDDARSVGGKKKKQRRRQTRNRKYKLSKKKSTKRVRRS